MFGPKTEAEEVIFAEEATRVEAQHMLQRRMNECGVDERELARRMGVPANDVFDFFRSGSDIKIRFLSRALWVLDKDKLVLSTLKSTSRSGVRRIDVEGR